jgi:hypothetical protein
VFVLFVLVFRSLWRSGGVLFVTAEQWRPKQARKQIVVGTKTRLSVLLFLGLFTALCFCPVFPVKKSIHDDETKKIERRNRVNVLRPERQHEWPHRISDFFMLWPDRQNPNQNEQGPYLFFISMLKPADRPRPRLSPRTSTIIRI